MAIGRVPFLCWSISSRVITYTTKILAFNVPVHSLCNVLVSFVHKNSCVQCTGTFTMQCFGFLRAQKFLCSMYWYIHYAMFWFPSCTKILVFNVLVHSLCNVLVSFVHKNSCVQCTGTFTMQCFGFLRAQKFLCSMYWYIHYAMFWFPSCMSVHIPIYGQESK